MDKSAWQSRIWGILLIVILLAAAAYFAWIEYMPNEAEGYPSLQETPENVPGFLRGKTEQNLPKAPVRE